MRSAVHTREPVRSGQPFRVIHVNRMPAHRAFPPGRHVTHHRAVLGAPWLRGGVKVIHGARAYAARSSASQRYD